MTRLTFGEVRILWGRDLLRKGVRWRVGDGSGLKVFRDPWLPRPHFFKWPPSFLMEDGIWRKLKICFGTLIRTLFLVFQLAGERGRIFLVGITMTKAFTL